MTSRPAIPGLQGFRIPNVHPLIQPSIEPRPRIPQSTMSHENESPGEDDESYDLTRPPTDENGPTDVVPAKPPSLNWKPSSRTVDESLADGISNEDLWMLIRRFNKQIYHVKAVPGATLDIDLNRADEERFPPEKLRMTLERFYTSVVVGVTEFCRHVGRLRSWKEPVRTGVFCGIYFVSWVFDLLIPTTLGLMVGMVMCPPIRCVLFPPHPVALQPESQASSAEPQSHDSLTGAPEAHKGEAAEQEAKNLVDSFATVAMETAAGKYCQAVAEDVTEKTSIPDTLRLTENGEAQPEDPPDDKTKKPMKHKVSQGTDQAMRIISDITDIYEKFANLLSPTPPFFLVTPRLRLAGILSIMMAVLPFTSSYWIIKSVGFTLGLAFFGDPIFAWTMHLLNTKFPAWQEQMDLQKYDPVLFTWAYLLMPVRTLLEGVPTNAQLTLTLLRIGEINSSPLPPPPTPTDNEPVWPIRRSKSKPTLSPTSTDHLSTTSPSDSFPAPDQKPKRRWVFKVLKFVRRTIATAIKGHIAVDRAMAIAGSAHTKNLIGMLQQRKFAATPFGPLKFDAKFERKRGAAVIDSSKEPPILYFTTYQSAGLDDLRIESRKKGSVLFQIPVTQICELKKTEGLGWKGRLIVELTAGSKEAADGLVVVGDGDGETFHLTGMRSRNQLFNRLVAIDAQFWESW
ncbi:hypothetical protein N7492_009957 [Penicillium capsulatum]|uniref:Uncharacterized protein n=1 Tax=Penicillium capsulatum TaxID=69766 RepID=A0A9W9HNN1_9EURO|nr:hypothetical protein N7492_009957 [Penicillium capsulatum]